MRNTGSSFVIKHDSTEHTIPAGDFEVTDEGLATFILNKARSWKLNVSKIGTSIKEAVEAIKAEPIAETISHEITEADLKMNPELKDAGVEVGEEIELPVEKEAKKTKKSK